MRGNNARAVRVALGLLGLLPLLVLACSSDPKPTTEAAQALARVTSFTQGQPALVFVYTDG